MSMLNFLVVLDDFVPKLVLCAQLYSAILHCNWFRYIFVADSMGIASVKWMQMAPMLPLCQIMHNDGHRAIQGHSRSLILAQSKPICDFNWRTSNMTGHHWGPKRKLGAGYRAPSLHRMSYLSIGLLCEASSNFHRRVWYHVLSLRYVCIMHVLNVRASSSPLSYPCAKFRFCRSLHFWASPWKKIVYSITHSFSQSVPHPAYLIRRKPKQ